MHATSALSLPILCYNNNNNNISAYPHIPIFQASYPLKVKELSNALDKPIYSKNVHQRLQGKPHFVITLSMVIFSSTVPSCSLRNYFFSFQDRFWAPTTSLPLFPGSRNENRYSPHDQKPFMRLRSKFRFAL